MSKQINFYNKDIVTKFIGKDIIMLMFEEDEDENGSFIAISINIIYNAIKDLLLSDVVLKSIEEKWMFVFLKCEFEKQLGISQSNPEKYKEYLKHFASVMIEKMLIDERKYPEDVRIKFEMEELRKNVEKIYT